MGANPPGWIEIIFWKKISTYDITCFNFGDDRLRGLASAEGQILPFSIDFDGGLQNTHTIPRECVVGLHPKSLPAQMQKITTYGHFCYYMYFFV